MSDRLSEYSISRRRLLTENPFWGFFALNLEKVEVDDPSLPYAAVGMKGYSYELIFRKDRYLDLPIEQQLGVLEHELYHIALGHLGPSYRTLCPDHRLFNIAADLVINQEIPRNRLPSGAVFLDCFPDFNLAPKESAIYYYNALSAELQKIKDTFPDALKCNPGNSPDCNSGNSPGSENSQTDSDSTDQGSSSQDSQGNSEQKQDQGSSSASMNPSQKSLLDYYGPDGSNWDSHDYWVGDPAEGESFDSYWETVEELRKELLKRVFVETNKTYGSKTRGFIPGNLYETIEKLLERKPATVSWKKIMKNFIAAHRSTKTRKTRRKPSRRFVGQPGLRVTPKHKILVAIDTSGSVSQDEIKLFFAEIEEISKADILIDVVQSDSGVSNVSPYKKNDSYKVYGRGGTDFTPVINYFNNLKSTYSCLVYLTDGCCSPPSVDPLKPILWIMTRGEISNYKPSFPGMISIMRT
jgi:predicted metal-dependent peptidase